MLCARVVYICVRTVVAGRQLLWQRMYREFRATRLSLVEFFYYALVHVRCLFPSQRKIISP